MRTLWIGALVLGLLPTVAPAEHRYDRGARYERRSYDSGHRNHGHRNHGHSRSRSSFDISVGFGSYRDDGYFRSSYSYGRSYRPAYRETHVYHREPAYVYHAPPPVVVYSPPPVYCPPPRVYYYEPCYTPRYSYTETRFHYGR